MNILIRPATIDDIQNLVHFQQSLASETENVVLDAAVLVQGLRAVLADSSKGTYFVAEVNGATAGCCFITYEWSEWRNGNVWWLQSVYVEAEFRKHGVFRKMYDNIWHSIENDPSVLGLRLYVDKRNDRAQKVYSGLGMDGEHYTVYERMKG